MAVDTDRLAQIRTRLGKKSSYESAVAELRDLVENDTSFADSPEALQLASRCMTLLRSRYTSVAFWKASLGFFESLQGSVPASSSLATWIDESQAVVRASSEKAELATTGAPEPYVFEGQLSRQDPPEQAPTFAAQLFQLLSQSEANEAEQADDGHSAQPATQPVPGQPDTLQQLREELEAAMLESLSEDSAPRARPPASAAIVRQLPIESLTHQRLQQLGGAEVQCSVCRQELQEADKVQVMPCAHVYHPPCLAPWLASHNDCPVCRQELPTDDAAYEREKEAALDAKGAANALSHQEFLYV